jgi:hypothetical protein
MHPLLLCVIALCTGLWVSLNLTALEQAGSWTPSRVASIAAFLREYERPIVCLRRCSVRCAGLLLLLN